ncbi:MAG TPA: hypothetical protein PK772_02145 [Chitinophagaceae bacterium]|nr:hypothetical protein [Chitinophagaceae bacterium]
MKIKLEHKEIELVDIWVKYLYPSLIRFCLKNDIGIEWKKNIIFISKEHQHAFNKMLEDLLQELLIECYKEPAQRQRTKHPGYFRNIVFNDKKYVLNYVTDIV